MAVQTPVPCQTIERDLKKKREQLSRLNDRPTPGGPIFKPGRDLDPELKAERQRLAKEIKRLDGQLTQCFLQNVPNAPVTVRFESLVCLDQNDEPFTESDEPYLIVYTLNIPNLANPVPDARAFKIGRFLDVDSGDTVFGAGNIWDTNGSARLITDPNSVVILVAMVEEDDTGVDVVRTAVQTLMIPIVASNIAAAATDPDAFRFRLMEGMQGAIRTAVKAAVGSQDDLIGTVQQIRLTRPMLDRVRRFGSESFTLNFSSSDTRYSARFRLQRA